MTTEDINDLVQDYLVDFAKYTSCQKNDFNLKYSIQMYLNNINHRYKDQLMIDVILNKVVDLEYFIPTTKGVSEMNYCLTDDGVKFFKTLQEKLRINR